MIRVTGFSSKNEIVCIILIQLDELFENCIYCFEIYYWNSNNSDFFATLQRFTYRLMKSNRFLLVLALSTLAHVSFAQKNDSIRIPNNFSGAVTVTTKGISTIPNLTLGKPAAIFDLSMGKRNLTFEPQLRFALEGRPWSFLFWWRYKVLKTEKFRVNIGAHPALSFKTTATETGGVTEKTTKVYRYLAGELSPGYLLSKNISIGMYYLYIRGIEKEITRNTNLLALRSNFSNIKISNRFFMGINPQIYYLKMDEHNGFYFNSSLTLAKSNFPVSLSAMFNKRIKSDIPADNDFIWNISLRYAFNKEYVAK